LWNSRPLSSETESPPDQEKAYIHEEFLGLTVMSVLSHPMGIGWVLPPNHVFPLLIELKGFANGATVSSDLECSLVF
jgi:hypothetical protein